jgi:hypothetical protein
MLSALRLIWDPTGPDVGYLQYRARAAGRVAVSFPPRPVHPKGIFKYEKSNRFVRLSFENRAYAYEIEENLIGPTRVTISRAGKLLTSFECSRASRTLMDTDTINLLTAAGLQ